jgi:ABC-type transport system involved in multi-copper enzyme maturation permease subunit
MGFANLLHNENVEWWGSRRWLKQACLWLLIVNGFVVINLFVLPAVMLPDEDVVSMMDPVSEGIRALFQLGATTLAIGTVILAQGEVIGERQTGIMAWILSKPVARPAYFLSKVVAHSIGIFVIMIGFQSAVAYGLLWFANGDPLPLLPFLLGVGGLTLHTFFYLALTLMLGVFARTRSQVLGVAMGSLFGGMLLSSLISQLGLITPWSLPNILPVLALQIPLQLATALTPILMTAIWSIVFIAAALWKIDRLEF